MMYVADMDQSTQIIKKVRKLNRKGKLLDPTDKELNEKKELAAALMVKCDKTEEEVFKAYDEFYLKHEDGSISNEEYINSASVDVGQTN